MAIDVSIDPFNKALDPVHIGYINWGWQECNGQVSGIEGKRRSPSSNCA